MKELSVMLKAVWRLFMKKYRTALVVFASTILLLAFVIIIAVCTGWIKWVAFGFTVVVLVFVLSCTPRIVDPVSIVDEVFEED